MTVKTNLIINPTKWLGDVNIISMEWDCKGMLIHLIMFSAQQEMPGYLPLNETLMRKVLENPSIEDWNKRIKPQLYSVLKIKKIEVEGILSEYIYYPEYIKELNSINNIKEIEPKKTRKKKLIEDIGLQLIDSDNFFKGFSLDVIIKAKTTTTILYEKSTQDITSNIWDVGVSILMPQKKDNASCRKLLGRLIKLYGAPQVSAAIADISSKNLQAANMEAFLIGIIKSKVELMESSNNSDGSQPPTIKNNKKRPSSFNGGFSRTINGRVVI